MNITVQIPIEQYNRMKMESEMLGRIAAHVGKYDRRKNATTYECVLKLIERERNLSKRIKEQ